MLFPHFTLGTAFEDGMVFSTVLSNQGGVCLKVLGPFSVMLACCPCACTLAYLHSSKTCIQRRVGLITDYKYASGVKVTVSLC